MSEDQSVTMARYFGDFAERLEALQDNYSVMRDRNGHDDAVFDLIRVLGGKSASWLAGHLAVAVADLGDLRAPVDVSSNLQAGDAPAHDVAEGGVPGR